MSDDAPGVEFDLGGGVQVEMEPTNDGEVRITFKENNGAEIVYSAVKKKTFFETSQIRQTVANKANEGVSDGVDGEQIKAEFEQLCSKMAAKSDEFEEAFRPPDVQQLLDETLSVEVFAGEPTQYTIELEHDGTTGRIEFTDGEWVTPSQVKARQRYLRVFDELIELDKDGWETLRDAWEEQKEIVAKEALTSKYHLASQIVGELSRVNPVDSRSELANDAMTAWYDENNSTGDSEVADRAGERADVIWVRVAAIKDLLKKAGKDPNDDFSQLSKTLSQDMGYAYTTSKDKSAGSAGPEVHCIGMDPEALRIAPENVQAVDDDEEVRP